MTLWREARHDSVLGREEPSTRRLCRRRARRRSDFRAQRHSPHLPSHHYLSSEAASDTRAPSLGDAEVSATAAAVTECRVLLVHAVATLHGLTEERHADTLLLPVTAA